MEWTFVADETIPADAVIFAPSPRQEAFVGYYRTKIWVSHPSRCMRIDGITAAVDPDIALDEGL